jgi:Protein of unknown function (DUF2946)
MGCLRRQKRLLGWLAAIALLGNVLATALLARTAAALTILDDVLGPITLCTADGAKTAPAGGPGPAEKAPADHCPACVTVAQLALAIAIIAAVFAFPLLRAGGPAPPWQRPLSLRLRLGGISPRAPPLFA